MSVFKKVFDEALAQSKIDDALFKRIRVYVQKFINKNEDHIRFFGSNLTGVYPVRFIPSDKNEWVDEILNIDEYDTRQKIIHPETGAVSEDWVRATDIMNISCLYLTYRFFNSNMSLKNKEEAMLTALMALHCKLISSLMAHFFKYPADEATAMATYAALSKKYAIKQQGSWHGVLLNRCQDIMDHQSIHYQTIVKFNDDDAIVYMIQDIQGRLRDMIKKLWRVFEIVRTQNAKILSNSGLIELDGKIMVKDMERVYPPYKKYINDVVVDKGRFIKPELVEVITSAISTIPEKLLYDALNHLTGKVMEDKKIQEFLEKVILHAFEYLGSEHDSKLILRNKGLLIARLKALYMASRSSDPLLLDMRNLGIKIFKKNIATKSDSVLASVRTGVMLYIVLRTFSKDYYN